MTKNNLLIVWHGGLGDHIICNAIVRAKAAIYDLVCLPVKYHNCPSVIYMFRDLPNVTIRPVYGDEDMLFFRDNVWRHEVLNIGGFGNNFMGAEWDCSMYLQAGVEFSDRWAKWSCQRDEVAEDALFEHVKKQTKYFAGESMIFWHEDEARGMKIKISKLPDDAKANPDCCFIGPGPITPVLFHWRKVIEACDEIHVIASSFAAFIDSIELPKNPKLFLHAYCRPGEPLMKVHKQWEVLL